MSHFPTEVFNTSLKAYRIISSVFVERLPSFDSKRIQKVHKLHKNKDVEIFRLFWSHSEVSLKRKWRKARSFVVELIVLEFKTESLGKSTELVPKTTKTSTFLTVQ